MSLLSTYFNKNRNKKEANSHNEQLKLSPDGDKVSKNISLTRKNYERSPSSSSFAFDFLQERSQNNVNVNPSGKCDDVDVDVSYIRTTGTSTTCEYRPNDESRKDGGKTVIGSKKKRKQRKRKKNTSKSHNKSTSTCECNEIISRQLDSEKKHLKRHENERNCNIHNVETSRSSSSSEDEVKHDLNLEAMQSFMNSTDAWMQIETSENMQKDTHSKKKESESGDANINHTPSKPESRRIRFDSSNKGKAMVNHESIAIHSEKKQQHSKPVPVESNPFSFGFHFDSLLPQVSRR
mmetsp:Transcript_26651/g.32849  ORF Transcript_26651/g.32849 Transcript_26651/m.32849 type:complete len:293 (+) Transcript_26651:65-943(+)